MSLEAFSGSSNDASPGATELVSTDTALTNPWDVFGGNGIPEKIRAKLLIIAAARMEENGKQTIFISDYKPTM